eukprot:gene26716-59715_t
METARALLRPQSYDVATAERQAGLRCGWPLCQRRIKYWDGDP